MKFIETIEIKNFKSIRHQKIEGCKRINVFIGYPNVGKSNILEALSLFSVDKSEADFNSFVRAEGIPTLFFNGDVGRNIEIRINNENRILGILESDRVGFHWQLCGQDASFDKIGPGIQQKIYGMLNFKVGSDNKIQYWDSIYERLPRSEDFYKELGEGYLAGIKKYSFNSRIAYSSNRYDFLSVPNGENIFDIIYAHPKIREDVAELFENYGLKLLFNSADKKFSILKDLSRGVIFSIPYTLVADTLRHLIFYKVAINGNVDSILLLEEPEAHMFPPYISKFTSDIMYEENRNQYFITTHSPFVLNDFMEHLEKDEFSIFAVGYKKETGETIVRKFADTEIDEIYQYGIDLFFNLENYLMNEA